jgi:hypothetical protein
MSTIVVKDWYQLDFKMKSPITDLKKIDAIMQELTKLDLVSKWFFLFEVTVIRVRMESSNKAELHKKLNNLSIANKLELSESLPFSDYAESSETLFNEETIKRFANIMSEITQLTVKKIKQDNKFDTYRIMERISHCVFNNMAGTSFKKEEYFLNQRIKERIGQAFDNDFESKIVENQTT